MSPIPWTRGGPGRGFFDTQPRTIMQSTIGVLSRVGWRRRRRYRSSLLCVYKKSLHAYPPLSKRSIPQQVTSHQAYASNPHHPQNRPSLHHYVSYIHCYRAQSNATPAGLDLENSICMGTLILSMAQVQDAHLMHRAKLHAAAPGASHKCH
jgi:hypothetical protein